MRDGSEYFQIYDTYEEDEDQTDADGKIIKVTHRIPIIEPLGLLEKGKAAIHLSMGVRVMISPDATTRKAYTLTFQFGDDARKFTNFFDKLRTETLPVPTE